MTEWNNKRVLVTGGAGFIGSHLTRRLVDAGADVAVLTRYDSVIDNVRIVDLWDRVKIIEADLQNLDSLLKIRAFKPEVVFHLAAYNHVGDSFNQVSEAMNVNGTGTANVLQAVGEYERFVYISTSEVYGTQSGVPFVETMTPQPVSPYSVGKYAGELYCRMLAQEMGHPIAMVRPFNAFGPYQSVRAVIAEMILTCLDGRPVHATQGTQTREFNFVENLVDGILLAGHKPEAIGKVINIGAGEEIAIRDMIHLVHELTASSSELHIGSLPNRPTEIWRMQADNKQARDLLGWSPRISFADGLVATIAWFKAYHKEFSTPNNGLQRLTDWRQCVSDMTSSSPESSDT